jgi:hypothetical protein
VNADYKVFVIFYINNFQVLYYKDNEARAKSIITRIKEVYELHDMRDIEWFLGVQVIRDYKARKL